MSALSNILGSRWTRCACRVVGLAIACLFLTSTLKAQGPPCVSPNTVVTAEGQIGNFPQIGCFNPATGVFLPSGGNGATVTPIGSDAGAQFNAIIAGCTSNNSSNCTITVYPGIYNFSTSVTTTGNLSIICAAPVTLGSATAVLNWINASGTMFTSNGTSSTTSFQMRGCLLNATANTSSVAIQLKRASQSHIENNHIVGFTGGIQTTGDGVSGNSTGIFISHNRIDSFCGSGSYALSIDHTFDLFLDNFEFYSTTDCATSIPLILDTGAGGIWIDNGTLEQGLHAGIIRNTNQGGSYGASPSAIFVHGVSFDLSPGGDTLLFDSTLSTNNTQWFCSLCWAKAAGKNQSGTVITSTAVGINIQGGSNINFWGGTSSKNSSWGYVNNSTGSGFSLTGMHIVSNNQGNTANVGGIQVSANPIAGRIVSVKSGNDSVGEPGGNQAYGADLSAVTAAQNWSISANDFKGNATARMKLPALGTLNVDIPEMGSSGGFAAYGGFALVEFGGPNGVAGSDFIWGDNSHAPKVNANNSGAHFLILGERGTGTCSGSTLAVVFGTAFGSAPQVLVTDRTTSGGVRVSTGPSTTGFTATCTGATDVFDWLAVGNPN